MPMFESLYDLGNIEASDGDNDMFVHPHDSWYCAVSCVGTVDEIRGKNPHFTDIIAGQRVYGVSEGQHDGKPATVLNLGPRGRMIFANDEVVEWVRDFHTAERDETDDDGFDAMVAFMNEWRNKPAVAQKLATVELDMSCEAGEVPEIVAAEIAAANGVSVRIINPHGPGGGAPVVEVSGLRENVVKALSNKECGWGMDDEDLHYNMSLG